MKFVTILALVATAQAAAKADNVLCSTSGDTCTTATSFCCLAYTTTALTTVSTDGFCKAALTADITTAATDLKAADGTTAYAGANTFFKKDEASCKAKAAGAANLAATVAAAATALYAMC